MGQKYPHLWFLPSNSFNIHASCTEFYDFVNRIAQYISFEHFCFYFKTQGQGIGLYIETPQVSTDPQLWGKVSCHKHHEFLQTTDSTLFPPHPPSPTHSEGWFIQKTLLVPTEPQGTARVHSVIKQHEYLDPQHVVKAGSFRKHCRCLQTHKLWQRFFQ